ncbi:MAG: hypothetical protein OEM27_05390 [Nitrospinota bacterium]|nr:hypothetical protein [Nitrospinota bacterium]
MKKLISVVSIFVLSLFMSSAFAAEPPMEQPLAEEPQAIMPQSDSVLERFAVWPFESIEGKSPEETAGAIDNVKVDQSVDADGKTHSVTGIDDPIAESD